MYFSIGANSGHSYHISQVHTSISDSSKYLSDTALHPVKNAFSQPPDPDDAPLLPSPGADFWEVNESLAAESSVFCLVK